MAFTPSIRSLTLDLPPSCIAFCLTNPVYFVVGTYLLHKPEDCDDNNLQHRTGTLNLFRLDGDDITHIATEPTNFAVLDIQWSPHDTPMQFLAVATSDGQIITYKLSSTGLHQWSRNRVADQSLLVLSLAWHPANPNAIAYTLSDGRVMIATNSSPHRWEDDFDLDLTEIYKHELEAWMATFSSTSEDVFSGGDDVVLQYSQGSVTCDREDYENFKDDGHSIAVKYAMQWKDRKLHGAGVTAIMSIADGLAVTGSYDDRIRLIGFATGRRPEVLAEHEMGGGVWRLKTLADPRTTQSKAYSLMILASCMHAGSRIVELSKDPDGKWEFRTTACFEEHKSMNYGSDVQPSSSSVKSIISTSFYDKLLCLWKVDLNCQEG